MITFIVNPAAGSGRSLRAVPIIERVMRASGRPYRVIETKTPGHAAELARQAACDGAGIVAAVGGDGTVQEIAAGLVNTEAALAIIPSGSGNDFIHSLNPQLKAKKAFDKRIEQFLGYLLRGEQDRIDAVRMNDAYFLNIGSVGIDAQIVVDAARLKKRFGKSSYLLSTLRNTVTYHPQRVRIECDGEIIDSDLSLAAICNGQFYGGGFNIAPKADMRDGFLTLCVIDKLARPMFGLLFPLVLFGAHTKLKQVRYITCKRLTVYYENTTPVNLDGNIYMRKAPLAFEIIEGGLKVIRMKD